MHQTNNNQDMKRLIYLMLSLVMVACTIDNEKVKVSMGGDDDSSITPEITLNQTAFNFDENSDTKTIFFYSAMEWTAELINERADGWCSIDATSGKAGDNQINISVTDNASPDNRTASIIIKSGPLSRTVRISQKQRDALTVTTSRFEVDGTAGKIYIEVKANIDFDYTINGSAKEWISAIETRALKSTKLGFNIAENSSTTNREGTITIHSGNMQEVVTVYQKGSEKAIIISKREYVVGYESEDIAVEVTSSVDVDIEMPNVDWITRNTSRAVSTNTYYFTVAENNTNAQREAYIIFSNKEKNISERVKIIQTSKNAIVVAKSTYDVASEGGQITIEVGHNMAIDYEIEGEEWISMVNTRAMTTDYFTFDIAPNDGYDSREGSIIFTSNDGMTSQTVTIYQAQKDAIIIGTRNIVLSAESGIFTVMITANVEFTISKPNVDWVRSAETTRGLSANIFYYEYDENNTSDYRTTNMVVTDVNKNISETISITQKPYNASDDTYLLLGTGYWTDDIIAPLFGVAVETYAVEVYENPSQPGFIFLKDLYTNAYAMVLADKFGIDSTTIPTWPTSYFAIDISDPAAVNIPLQYTGLDFGYGDMGIWSLEPGTLEDGVITFPLKGLAVSLDEGAYYSNYNAMTKLQMPENVDYMWSKLPDYSKTGVAVKPWQTFSKREGVSIKIVGDNYKTVKGLR